MSIKFSALLLAAGKGTRLLPHTKTTPKCMIPISGKPLMEIWINKLAKCHGLKKIFINTSYLAEIVNRYIENHANRPLIELIHEKKLLGTAGTLKKLSSRLDEEFTFIAHADNLSVFCLDDFIQAHLERPKNCEITMMTFQPDDPKSCGMVQCDTIGVVKSFIEKPAFPTEGRANGAVYIFSNTAIKQVKDMTGIVDLSVDVLPKFIGKIFAWHNQAYHRDIGTPDSYAKALKDFKNKEI